MNYRNLGKYGIKVSEVGLGSWLTYGNATESETAERCIARACDLGINFFDTANAYARGASEVAVGRALAHYPRESFVLATKVYFNMGSGPNDRGLSRKHIFEQCHASLKRLGTDYIDLYQCHRYDESTPLEETLQILDDLTRQGKILYSGVSEWTAPQIAHAADLSRAHGWQPLASNQPQYSLLARGIEKEVVPLCEREGIGQVVFSPLAQGLLTGKYKPGQPPPAGSRAADPKQNQFLQRGELDAYVHDRVRVDEALLTRIQKLVPLAQEAGLSMSQLALAWILRQSDVSSVIIGASRPEQIDDNAAASGVRLTPEIIARTEAVLVPETVSPTGLIQCRLS